MPRPAASLLAVLALSCVLCAATPAAEGGPEALRSALAARIAASGLDAKVKAFATEKLLPLMTEPVWVAEAKAQNARKVSLADIKALDARWMKAEEELPEQKACLTNPCAQAVKAEAAKLPALREVFVMDDQGANVGQNSLTSDYWQGDEEKWSNSYAGGKGGLDAGKAKFDKSANTTLQQVSLPLVDADGTVVGAVCFGIDLGAL